MSVVEFRIEDATPDSPPDGDGRGNRGQWTRFVETMVEGRRGWHRVDYLAENDMESLRKAAIRRGLLTRRRCVSPPGEPRRWHVWIAHPEAVR